MKIKLIFWAFIVASIVNVFSQFLASAQLNQFTKPILMPLLIFYVYESSKGKVTLRILWLCLAIFLSWLGDVALLYQANGELFFMIGIGFFLLAQVTYIVVLKKSSYQLFQFNLIKVIPFVVYPIILFAILIPNAGNLAVPIFVYGIVISVMAGTARLRENVTSRESFQLAFYGSLLFVASDSILALNKFYVAIPLAGVWVMSTYIGAQLLLVLGLLKHSE